MKKVSYYLVLLVAVSLVPVSLWVYQKYFKNEIAPPLLFTVARGTLEETVKARGEVIAQKEFNLEFPFGGTVENVFVGEGDEVRAGEPLMKLETTDFELEKAKLEAILAQNKANAKKLAAGATKEDLEISQTKVSNAAIALDDAKKNLVDKLQDAYTKADDAVRNKTDQFFSNPQSDSPSLNLLETDSQLATDVEWGRLSMEFALKKWKTSINQLTAGSDLSAYLKEAKENLEQTKSFLDKTALAVNNPNNKPNSVSQTTYDVWRTDVATARTNVNTAIVNVSAAEEKLRTAESGLSLAENELSFKKAGTRSEDIAIAEAQIKETENQIAAIGEKIKKSTLSAPAAARVVKIYLEKKEVFRPGETAITLFTAGYKIQSDISELEIGKIRESNGNDVGIRLDAFPEKEFSGKVVSVEPKEIIKDEDKYYRVNVYLNSGETEIRSGMSTDLIIKILTKESALTVPELAVFKEGGKKFVNLVESGAEKDSPAELLKKLKKMEVETGISDGDYIEIISGLSEGQTIAVPAD